MSDISLLLLSLLLASLYIIFSPSLVSSRPIVYNSLYFWYAKSEEQHCAYKEANKAAKIAVAMAKEEAYEELYT